jgi:hypothetical protein
MAQRYPPALGLASTRAKHYSIAPEALRFFDAVLQDANVHLKWGVGTLAYWACTTERQLKAARALQTRLGIEA